MQHIENQQLPVKTLNNDLKERWKVIGTALSMENNERVSHIEADLEELEDCLLKGKILEEEKNKV